MVDALRQLRRFTVERVTGEADDAEEARQVFASALLGPVQRRPFRIRVDQRDALSPPAPFSGEVERPRRLADAALLIAASGDQIGRAELEVKVCLYLVDLG